MREERKRKERGGRGGGIGILIKLVFRQVTLLTPTRVLPLSGEDCRSSQGRPSSPLPPVAPPIEQHKVLLVFLSCCWGSGGRGPSRLSCPFSCLFCPTQIPQRREGGVVSSSGCIVWYEALARREGERFVLRSRTIKMSRHDKKGGKKDHATVGRYLFVALCLYARADHSGAKKLFSLARTCEKMAKNCQSRSEIKWIKVW